MATEVGSAYVTLLPTAKGFASKMQKELAGEVARAGKSLGKSLGEEVGEEGGKEAAESFESPFSSGLKKIGAVAGGAAIGALLVKGIGGALAAGDMNAKLTAQLGLTKKESARAGRVAGDLFGQNYGNSMEQVNEAIAVVVRDIDGMRGASEDTLGRISTKALNTANIFDQDLGAVTRAVSQLMRTGLAGSADEAFDIVTKGFQSGADKSEDFLDTLNEYGTQFRKLGIDGETATGLISQGLKAGARDGDIVADALKEFSIRAVDGSDASKAAFQQLGLSASKMTNQIAKGGKPASAGLQTVLDKLRGIKDPIKREAAAVGLFGSQAEDLGKALFKLDPSKAADGLGKVAGSADRANAAFNDTPTARVQAFTRQLQQGLTNAMAKYVIPALDSLTPLLADLGPVLDTAGAAVKGAFGFLKDNAGVFNAAAAGVVVLTGATVAHSIALAVAGGGLKKWILQTKIVQVATKVWAAMQWLLNAALTANPIGLIVVGIAALIAIIVLVVRKLGGWDATMKKLGAAWDAFKSKMAAVWTAVKSAVVKGVKAVVDYVKGLPSKAQAALKSLGNKLSSLFSKAWDTVKRVTTNGATAVVTFVTKLPGKAVSALRSLGSKLADLFRRAWDTAGNAVSNGVDSVVTFIRKLPGRILDLGASFLSAGRAIIGKFVDGLQNAAGIISGISGNVWDALQGLLNGAINQINAALEFSIPLPGKNLSINPPNIPTLATGGRVTAATVAIIGEGREPETVLPDSLLRGLMERSAAAGAAGGVGHLTITNWRDGTGFFRVVADQSVADEARFRRNLGAMNA